MTNPKRVARLLKESDITYVWTVTGWLYLAVVIDLFSGEVVGCAMAANMETTLCIDALEMALQSRSNDGDLTHHSDRGSQHASKVNVLSAAHIKMSMSRRGKCWDNAPVESFFGTLKKELVYRNVFANSEAAKLKIFEYIEVFYNQKRRHFALWYMTPTEYESSSSCVLKAA